MNRLSLSVFIVFVLAVIVVRFFLSRKSRWAKDYSRFAPVRAEAKLLAFAAAFFMVVMALSGYTRVEKGIGSEYLFVFDISPSQNLKDCPGEGGKMISRLECAKAAMRESVKKMPPHSSVALGALAGYGYEIFLSPTPVSRSGIIEDRLTVVNTWNAWDSGAELRYLPTFLQKTIGGWRKPLTVVIFSDGDTLPIEKDISPEIMQFYDKGIWLVFVGVGKEVPSIVPGIGKDGKLSDGCFMEKKSDGESCYTSGLYEKPLKESAAFMKGSYFNLIKEKDKLIDALIQKAPHKSEPVPYEVSMTWRFAVIAIACVLIWVVL